MTPLLAAISEEVTSRLELAREPAGWARLIGLALLLAACWLIFFIYRREGRIGASRRLRVTLACIRTLVVLTLIAVWLEPVIATYVRRVITARVAVLLDSSGSMSIADGAADAALSSVSRAQRVAELLDPPNRSGNEHYGWLRRLDSRNHLALYSFGQRVERLPMPWPGSTSASQPVSPSPDRFPPTSDQNRTDIGGALRTALADAGGEPLAAVVLVTDGQVNSGLARADLVEIARGGRVPVYCVGVGSPQEPLNVAVNDLVAPDSAARGDPLEMTARLNASGIEDLTVQVDLVEQQVRSTGGAPPQADRVVATARTTLTRDKPDADVPFRITAETAGEFVYTARLIPVEGDRVPADNQRSTPVSILDERVRVLVIAGRPSYEYRALTRLLLRDKSFDTSCWLQSADQQAVRDGTTIITELPRKPEDLFAFDVILLLDPNPAEFDSAWCITARRFVDDLGGGLMFVSGPAYSARYLRDARLEDILTLLPVAPDPDAELRVNERGSFQNAATAMRVLDDALNNPIMRLGTTPEVARAAWSRLPGALWFLPVQREKPLANVLLRTIAPTGQAGEGPVLLAGQPFGAGRVVFMSFDGTWRWRTTAEPLYDRFWIQMLRYLGQARRQGQSKRGVVVLDRESGQVGETVKIEARVLDDAFAPLSATQIEGELSIGDSAAKQITLSAIPGRDGWFTGRALLGSEGAATITIPLSTARTSTKPAESLVKHLMVRSPNVEMHVLRQDVELLEQIAAASGGKYFPIEKAASLPDQIEDASRVTTPRQANPKPLWDRSWLMLTVIGLLCVEWTLRRRNHLL